MIIDYKIEEVVNNGFKEYHIFDITNEEKVLYAGCAKKFTWNMGMKSEINRLEPFSTDGERISHGLSSQDNITPDALIECVKRRYESYVERQEKISDKWKASSLDAARLGVSEESFKKYDNTRIYIDNVVYYEERLTELQETLSELEAYGKSIAYGDAPKTVRALVDKHINQIIKDIKSTKVEIENYKGYLKKY